MIESVVGASAGVGGEGECVGMRVSERARTRMGTRENEGADEDAYVNERE